MKIKLSFIDSTTKQVMKPQIVAKQSFLWQGKFEMHPPVGISWNWSIKLVILNPLFHTQIDLMNRVGELYTAIDWCLIYFALSIIDLVLFQILIDTFFSGFTK